MNNLAAFVVTLRRATSRAEQVKRIIEKCPLPCQVTDAVDGKELTRDQIASVYQPNLYRPRYPFELNVGEIGCFLSHRNLWQRMADENSLQTLIVEDDVELEPGFMKALEFASATAIQGDYLQFQVRPIKTSSKTIAEEAGHRVIAPTVTPLRTSAQLVTLEAAKRLLKASKKFDRPVDAFLQMRWITGVRMTAIVPSRVHEVSASLGGSTIGAGKKSTLDLSRTIRREVLRPIYRSRVASYSKRAA